MNPHTPKPPQSSEVEIRLLGPFRIAIDGVTVEERAWTRRKSKTLVKLLALQPHHQLHREQVMDLLWPEQEPEAALNSLHKTIHAARRALEPNLKSGADSQFILTQGQQVLLRAPGKLWIDVEEFERLGTSGLKMQEPATAEAALEFYQGEPLSEDIYEDWAASRREQLRMLYQQLLNHLARIYEARGDYRQSIERLNQLIAATPADEEAHRNLMRLYALTDNRQQSLQQYQLCRDVLRRDLDAEPERATVALHAQILASRASASAISAIVAGNLPQPADSTESIEKSDFAAIVSRPLSETSSESKQRPRLALFGVGAAVVLLLALAGIWLIPRAGRERPATSLVVLPFANESADQNLEYLSDGITESIINNLTELDSLRVMARTTAFRYKNRAADPQAAGRDLNVEAVLTGKLQQRGENLIVQADLVRVSDGAQIWGEQYNLKTTDAFTVQQRISREITEKLRMRLTNEQEQRLAKNFVVNPEAYQHYLRGRYHWNRRTVAEVKKSIEEFRLAIAAEPGYALAYSGLADAYNSLSNTHLAPTDAIPLARSAALKALELDEQLAEARTSLGVIKWRYEWDWRGAEAEFKLAQELNPNYSVAWQRYGLLLIYQKKFDAGRQELLKAEQLDPLSLTISSSVGLSYYFERQYDLAIQQWKRTLDLDQNFPYGHFFLGWVWEQKKDYARAIAAFQRATQIDNTVITRAYLAHGLAVSGNRAEAEKLLGELQKQSTTSYVSPYYLAIVHAGLGENDKALDALERGLEDHSDSMALLGVEPKFDGLRSSQRFTKILNRVGLTP